MKLITDVCNTYNSYLIGRCAVVSLIPGREWGADH